MRQALSLALLIGVPAAGALTTGGCGGGPQGPAVTHDPRPTTVAMSSGDGQHGNLNAGLPEPLVVRVTDVGGNGVGRVAIQWRVTSGEGRLASATGGASTGDTVGVTTDAGGYASVRLTLTGSGVATIEAVAAGLRGSPVLFVAQAGRPDWPAVSDTDLVFDRVSYWPPIITYHGGLYERYVFREDGTFGLQFSSGRWGFFEYGGTYGRAGGGTELVFAADSRWRALARFHGECVDVEYNLTMYLSDFVDGEYCRAPPGP